jgi:hypothetical protein
MLNDAPNVIIGVLPREFHFAPAQPADFWMSLHANSSCELRRSCHNLYGVARLADGVSPAAAAANVASIAKTLEQQFPDSNRDQGGVVVDLSDVVVGNVRILILLISGALLRCSRPPTSRACCCLIGRPPARAGRAAALGATARVIAQFVTEACARCHRQRSRWRSHGPSSRPVAIPPIAARPLFAISDQPAHPGSCVDARGCRPYACLR